MQKIANVHHAIIVVAVQFLLLTGIVSAQAQLVQDWEYLVVSYGETVFTNPFLDPDVKTTSRSKVLAFSAIGVTIPSEAITTQENMDVLGRFGWELVSIVGAIGGDQQLIFKRPFDAERSALEAERIRQEGEAILEVAQEIDASTLQLVDLDAVEDQAAVDARNAEGESAFREMIEAAAGDTFDILKLDLQGSTTESGQRRQPVIASLVLDATDAALVDANTYRSGLVTNHRDQFKDALLSQGFDVSRGVTTCGNAALVLRIDSVIRIGDQQQTVASEVICFFM